MIIFRADGNAEIGSGHIMRCLSIADALRERGEKSVFISAGEEFESLILGRGYDFISLETDYRELTPELPALLSKLEELQNRDLNLKMVIIDSYFATMSYFETIKQKYPVAYIDDLMSNAFPVDLLINYNIYADEDKYIELYEKAGRKLPLMLLGAMYAPLRREFENVPPIEIKEMAEKILILTGGADPMHLAMKFAEEIVARTEHKNSAEKNGFESEKSMREPEIHFIVGAMSHDYKNLCDITDRCRNIIIEKSVSDMKNTLQKFDLVVSAAGSTQYEICACGVPAINYAMADNQLPGAECFGKNGIFFYAGDVRYESNFMGKIIDMIYNLIPNKNFRSQMAEREKKVTDGCGAGRIADAILQ